MIGGEVVNALCAVVGEGVDEELAAEGLEEVADTKFADVLANSISLVVVIVCQLVCVSGNFGVDDEPADEGVEVED